MNRRQSVSPIPSRARSIRTGMIDRSVCFLQSRRRDRIFFHTRGDLPGAPRGTRYLDIGVETHPRPVKPIPRAPVLTGIGVLKINSAETPILLSVPILHLGFHRIIRGKIIAIS